MNIITKYLAIFVAIFCFSAYSQVVYAGDIDVYIAYSNKDKADKKVLEEALSGYKVKSYKVDLLAMADYSGKQKAAAKLSQAKVVVFLKDKPGKYLDAADLGAVVYVDGSSASDVAKVTAALE